ncbi:iron complex transport system ATP-binding protein [Austwickia chelonae]|uniref:Putative iron-siderophore ABC transporter ATP-binding protein n=1 Tax=Austwickia chelonae NBRC 105200 TaxID=1184607 RepID=K6WC53_9MICO|nr:ABC transporter ATP-binding protein [Austwickia chelonae]GAB79427.1 putative iron-siderophore ABC transporter ATP-binding protein [Austwickia chelonae NBRC 105200]SEW36898.1 iron complex transport system ATP-binding protein [Austwickia chelonae]
MTDMAGVARAGAQDGDGVAGAAACPVPPLAVEQVELGYGERLVVHGVDLEVPAGQVTVLVGANGSGKSTLLRAMARLLVPRSGRVVLDGVDLAGQDSRDVARRVGLLPQTAQVPDGITVAQLVMRGRHPHRRRLFPRPTFADDLAVARALEATDLVGLAGRQVAELSGGQRQRVWLAMVLAQDTGVLLLDEPTSYLDLAHQVDVLDLVRRLSDENGITVVMVLHDLAMAARYADHLVAVKDGRVAAEGCPVEVLTVETVAEVFGITARIVPDPDTGTPVVLPRGRMSKVAGDMSGGALSISSAAEG